MFINRGMDKEDVHIYNGMLPSHLKNEIMPFASTQRSLESNILSEVNQTEKEKYNVTSLMRGIYKDDTNELIYKTETDSQKTGEEWRDKLRVQD